MACFATAARKTVQGNRGRDTKAELAVRRIVHAQGLHYRVNARPEPGIRWTADLLFTRARVAVFIDGCFWHGCPALFTMPATNTAFWLLRLTTTCNGMRTRLPPWRIEDGSCCASGSTRSPCRWPFVSPKRYEMGPVRRPPSDPGQTGGAEADSAIRYGVGQPCGPRVSVKWAQVACRLGEARHDDIGRVLLKVDI